MTGMDQIAHTLSYLDQQLALPLGDEYQPKYTHVVTWARVGLHMGVTPRLYQGHLEVTKRSIQPKKREIVIFCCFSTILFI